MRKLRMRVGASGRAGLAAIVAGLVLCLVAATPAGAASRPDPKPVPATAQRTLVGSASGDEVGAAACRVWAFGYAGWAKCDSHQLTCDFNSNGTYDESWVIADNRTIWHTWPGAGRWHEMPNNGRADDTYDCYTSNGNRVIEVWVNNSGRWWSWRDGGTWRGWYRA
ncbi:hypothetical protein GA0070606_3219 [Micromonospora citrea]|uniref:Peptidase inhibitor family I36 n=1 Tax=Micromonospora citrea TaxID=47855 RepID=A0A1C6V1F6_9ACTN|nr:hypothetical protein [Micromonospora citrea]SCL60113.1 hypothetical protein GA0070606_3219 [Micromonospora citrea]